MRESTSSLWLPLFPIIGVILLGWIGNATYQWFIGHRAENLKGRVGSWRQELRLKRQLRILARIKVYSVTNRNFYIQVVTDIIAIAINVVQATLLYLLGMLLFGFGVNISFDQQNTFSEVFSFSFENLLVPSPQMLGVLILPDLTLPEFFQLLDGNYLAISFVVIGLITIIVQLVNLLRIASSVDRLFDLARTISEIDSKGGVAQAYPELKDINVESLGFAKVEIF